MSVVRKAEHRDFGVVERGVADVARVWRPPQSRRAAQNLLCAVHINITVNGIISNLTK